MKLFSAIARAVGVAAFAGAMASAHAGFVFTVDESPYGGGQLDADKLNGGYVERITFDGMGNFATTAYADFGLFFLDSSTVSSQIDDTYALYAVFTSSGTVTPVSATQTNFTGADGSFTLYLDVNQDTTKTLGATGNDPVTLGNTADDLTLAFATDISSAGGVLISNLGGFFDLVWDDFTLTADGENYFIEPSPFYFQVNVDGDFDSFSVAGTQTVRGDVSAVFIPEPGSLALVGLALAGLGFAGRRRKA